MENNCKTNIEATYIDKYIPYCLPSIRQLTSQTSRVFFFVSGHGALQPVKYQRSRSLAMRRISIIGSIIYPGKMRRIPNWNWPSVNPQEWLGVRSQGYVYCRLYTPVLCMRTSVLCLIGSIVPNVFARVGQHIPGCKNYRESFSRLGLPDVGWRICF